MAFSGEEGWDAEALRVHLGLYSVLLKRCARLKRETVSVAGGMSGEA